MNQPQKFNKVTVLQYRKMTGKDIRTCFENVRELNKLGEELNETPNTWPRPRPDLNSRELFRQTNGLLGRV